MTADTKIFLSNGLLIEDTFSDGMYRAIVNGSNFCSPTREGLLAALGFFFSVYTADEPVKEPEIPLAVKMCGILFGLYPLEDRQKAFKTLEGMTEDAAASQAVAYIKRKPASFGATYLTRILGKQDFAQVTAVDISENVPSVVHRAELLDELGERLTAKCWAYKLNSPQQVAVSIL